MYRALLSWNLHRLAAAIVSACLSLAVSQAHTEPVVSTFTLANRMQVVVIPDHRVPIVTHMVCYRAGAADDPDGASGIAHFLEHLMFKSTRRLKSGEFSRIITRLGGRDNAKTEHDTTCYFERVAKEHLGVVMELEADRMVNLRLAEDEVRTERDVIQEERRSTVDADPVSLLGELMLAGLYRSHPYRRPVLGWADEMSKLTRQDAAAFYKRFYAPNNAVLVVAGDVAPEEVRRLAEATYGRNGPVAAATSHALPPEPEPIAARRVHLQDARAGASVLLRYYHVPSYASARQGEAESLQLLAQILGGDDTSRLYRRLVAETLAVGAGANYVANARDSGRMIFLVISAAGLSLEKVEAALDAVIADVRANGVTQEELDSAKSALEAKRVFDSDNQMTLARRYGEGLALGRSIADVDALPSRTTVVGSGDIKLAAGKFFAIERSVTGTLTPAPTTTTITGRPAVLLPKP